MKQTIFTGLVLLLLAKIADNTSVKYDYVPRRRGGLFRNKDGRLRAWVMGGWYCVVGGVFFTVVVSAGLLLRLLPY
jgi:hypothetical protein